jgi:hypothetical protein
MLLTRLVRRLRRLHQDEGGVALAAVIGLMLVGVVLSSLIITSVVTVLSTTTASRAGVQSEAAAEAGVDVALANLTSGNCLSSFSSATAPKYTATIYYSNAATLPSSTGWTAGCPTAVSTYVKVHSVGTAAAGGEAHNTSQNTAAVDSIYSRPVATSTIVANGPAIFAYSSQDFTGSGTLLSPTGIANVFVKTGNVNCSGGAAAQGTIIVTGGNLALSGSCGATGNAIATGTVTLSGGVSIGGYAQGTAVSVNSGTVTGSIYSSGATTLSPAVVGGDIVAGTTAYLTSSATVGGSLWAGSTFTSAGGTVNGTASATGIIIGSNDKVQGNDYSTGNVKITSGGSLMANSYSTSLTYNGSTNLGAAYVNGASTLNATANFPLYTKTYTGSGSNIHVQNPVVLAAAPATPATPAIPVIPAWVPFQYKAADWTGFSIYTFTTQAQCSVAGVQAAITSFSGGKGVIDARVCSAPLGLGTLHGEGGTKVYMANDLAIVTSKGFDLDGSSGFVSSKSAPNASLWLIQPDGGTSTSTTPTCPSGSSFIMPGGFTFGSNISVMMFSPCEIDVSSGTIFTGQIFAGATQVNGSATVTYQAVGLPGYDLSTGLTTTVSTTTNNWSLVLTRNV